MQIICIGFTRDKVKKRNFFLLFAFVVILVAGWRVIKKMNGIKVMFLLGANKEIKVIA